MKSLFKLKSYLYPYRYYLLASLLLSIPLAALRIGPAPLVKFLVDDILVSKNEVYLMYLPFAVVALYGLNFVVRFFHYYLLRIAIIEVNRKLKNDSFDHVLGLSAEYFTKEGTGQLISRVGMDPHFVDGGLSTVLQLVREPITFLGLLTYAFYLNWWLALLTLAVLPLMALVFYFSGKHLKRYMAKMQEENAALFSSVQESISGIRIVKIFRLESFVRKKFQEKSDGYARFHLKTARVEEAAHPAIELITSIAIGLVLYAGGKAIVGNQMSTGELLSFFATFGLMVDPLRKMNDINIRLHQASAATDRIFDLFSWKPRQLDPERPKAIDQNRIELEFKDVSFSYPDDPDRNVLQGVNFEVKQGKKIAFVGESGSGKSSLISLIPRLFDVNQGSIVLNDHDVRDYAIQDLRNMISVVSQDVFLFNDTIYENIRCGRLDATKEEIFEAAKHANALEFIENTPESFQTQIAERGQKLSGGQRQRLSIARAFLRKAPLLILDEATSNLDSLSEKAVTSALSELMKEKTTILIAHRLSTIKNVDQIYVIHQGKIVEQGKHEELLLKKGKYFHLYEQQKSETSHQT